MNCRLCPRMCGSDRTEKENKNGFCKMPLNPRVARADLHFWEEPSVSGKNGSGTVFFSGCSLDCVYCQNWEVSHKGRGKTVSTEELAEIFKELENKGANNINLVTPSHYVLAIREALDIYKPKIPIIYNSSGYDSIESLKMLEGYVDVYLLDLKYLNPDRALKYSGAYNYPEIAKSAIKEAYRQSGKPEFENGIIKRGLIVRHLLMPLATKEAMAVFDWVRANTPDAYFSIMSQYLPLGDAEKIPEINRKVTKREYEKVLDYIMEFDSDNVYIQEKSSANECFIPDFKGEILCTEP